MERAQPQTTDHGTKNTASAASCPPAYPGPRGSRFQARRKPKGVWNSNINKERRITNELMNLNKDGAEAANIRAKFPN